MKKRLLFSFCFLLVVIFQTYAQIEVGKRGNFQTKFPVRSMEASGNKLVYQLCGDDIAKAAGVDNDVELRAYIRVSAKQWKGCKITNIEFGIGYDAGRDSYAFISKDLDADPIISQYYQCDTIPISEEQLIGWKNVPLDVPYTIDSDEDLYIGWYTIQRDYWDRPFATDENTAFSGANLASYRRPGEENWTYQKMENNVSVRVTIEGDKLLQNHLRMISTTVDKLYYKLGEDVSISGSIINEGILPVESFDVTYKLNDAEPVTEHMSGVDIQSLQSYDFNFKTPINKEGRGTLTLTVSNPNGKQDEYPENTSIEYDTFGCLAKPIQRNVIVDEAVGVDDVGAPAAAKIIQEAIDNCDRKENVIWIQNHVLADDEYTINGFKNYGWLYDAENGVIFSPSVNIDHKTLPGTLMLNKNKEKVQATSEMFIIDDKFGDHLKTCLDDDGVYFSLGLECQLMDDDRIKVTMKVSPAIEGLFPTWFVNPKIALLLIEDNVIGRQAGVDGDYVHNHVPRAFLNEASVGPDFEFLGEVVPFPKEGFTLEREYAIPDTSWKIDNMSLIFYVMDATMVVHNAVICPVNNIQSVQSVTGGNSFTVSCNDDILHIDGDFDKAWIFNINGSKLIETSNTDTNVGGWAKGAYSILIQKDNHFVSTKFIVK